MKHMRIIVLITAVTALLASCASFKAGVKESDPLVVCEHINKGDSDTLSEVSVLPFVFDTEILESDSQIRSLWSGIIEAGYKAKDPRVKEFRAATPADASLFSDSWEIRTYFKNLILEDDMLARIKTDTGSIILILRPEKGSGSRIVAFTEGK
jgi:hypothetical protein